MFIYPITKIKPYKFIISILKTNSIMIIKAKT